METLDSGEWVARGKQARGQEFKSSFREQKGPGKDALN